MRNIITLIKNNFKISIIQKPFNFIIMCVAPILILLLASQIISTDSSYLKIGIVDKDNTVTSQRLISLFKDSEGVDIKTISEDEISNEFGENNINAVIKFDKGFEKDILSGKENKISIVNKEGEDTDTIIKGLLSTEVVNLRNLGAVSKGNTEVYKKAIDNYKSDSAIVEKSSLNDLYTDYNNSSVFIGFLIMFMFFKANSIASVVNEDKERNIYTRIFVAPVKTWQYYIANVISNVLIISLQILIAILGMKYLAKVSVGIPFTQLFIILFITTIVSVSLGTLCISITEKPDESSIVSNIINMLYLMLGGCFVPARFFPSFMDKLSYFSPARWVMDSIINIQQGFTFKSILPNLGIALLFAIAFFLISAYITSRKDKVYIALG